MIWNLLRRRAIAPIAAVCVVCVVCAIAPAAARADLDHYYCGSPGNYMVINAGARCVHGHRHLLTRVSAHEKAPLPSDVMCSLGKQYSDGSGANVTPAVCHQPYYSGNTDSYCTSGYTCVGWATTIHQQGPYWDNFYGHLWAVW